MAARKKRVLTPEEQLDAALVPESEWPHEIPENWCWTRLGSITEVVGGGTPSTRIPEYYDDGDIPWLSPADLSDYHGMYISRGAKNISSLGLSKSSARLMPAGTVCLSTRAPIGYVAIAENNISTNQGFKSFLPSKCFIPEYLYWYLKANKAMLESRASGTTFLELSGRQAKLIDFPLPPLPEQRRIASRIEWLFAKLDDAEAELREIIEQSEVQLNAILEKAIKGDLTVDWRAKHGISNKTWQKMTLESVAMRIFDGPFGSHLKTKDYIGSGVRVVRLENLRHLYFDDSKQSYVSEEKYDEIKAHTVLPSDIIMSTFISGNMKVCQLPEYVGFAANKADCIGIRPRQDVCTTFLLYALASTSTFEYLAGLIHGSTRPRVNTRQIKSIPIAMPCIEEQEQIAIILDGAFAKYSDAMNNASSTLELIAKVKAAILMKALCGELGTNDPDEPSSKELLASILSGNAGK